MRGICVELLHYITEAIDMNMSDTEINNRIETVANREDVSSEEYCQIYEQAMLAYNTKYNPLWQE